MFTELSKKNWGLILLHTHGHKLKYLSYDSHQLIATEFIKVRGKKVTWLKDLNYCPHSHSQINEREYALNIVRENDYPKRFLNDSLKPTVCKNHTSNSDGDTSVKSLAASPYIHGVTGQIKRILSNKQFPLYRLIFILAKSIFPERSY